MLLIVAVIFVGISLFLFMLPGRELVAKTTVATGHTTAFVGWLCLLAGFKDLSDPCDAAQTIQCGLTCGDPSKDFESFVLCAPWAVDEGIWSIFTGLAIFLFFPERAASPLLLPGPSAARGFTVRCAGAAPFPPVCVLTDPETKQEGMSLAAAWQMDACPSRGT